jgi:hypothetical protein
MTQTMPPNKADSAPWIPDIRLAAAAMSSAAMHCHHKILRMGLLPMRNIMTSRSRANKPIDCNNAPPFRQSELRNAAPVTLVS